MKTVIPDLTSELQFKTSRSGGKGGQHVNKVSSKVELLFYPSNSSLFSEEEKGTILNRLQQRLTKEGALQIVVQTERSQFRNKQIAIERLYLLLSECFVEQKERKATKIPRSVIAQRLISKKRKSELKRFRREKDW